MLTVGDRPVFVFFGGMVQILGGIGEWLIGNTFSCALFFTYGLSLSLLFQVSGYGYGYGYGSWILSEDMAWRGVTDMDERNILFC